MISITQQQEMGNVPVEELAAAAGALRGPRLDRLPDKRLREVGLVMILGRLAGQSRLIRQMARGMREGSGDVLGRARGFYRFI